MSIISQDCCCCSVTKSCLTLFDPRDWSLPGSSIHGILQARILEWVAISFFWGSSQPRNETHVSCVGRQILYHWAAWEVHISVFLSHKKEQNSVIVEMWMDLESVIQNEMSEREKQILYINTYMWNLEKWYRGTYLQDRNRYIGLEKGRVDTAGEGEGGTNWEIRIDIHTLLLLLLLLLSHFSRVRLCVTP